MKRVTYGEFGAGRPDFGGRWPRGEALGPPKKRSRGPQVQAFHLRSRPVTTSSVRVEISGPSAGVAELSFFGYHAGGWNRYPVFYGHGL